MEQTIGDVDPLRRGSRLVPLDLRTPSNFDRVYRIPGAARGIPADPFGASAGGGDRFVRISGAVTAVFPRSEYTPTRGGLAAEIPAGTVFHIGRLDLPDAPVPPRTAPGQISSAAPSMAVGGPVDARAWTGRIEPLASPPGGPAASVASPPAPPGARPSAPVARAGPDRSLPAAGLLADVEYRARRTRLLLDAAVGRALAGGRRSAAPPPSSPVPQPESVPAAAAQEP